MLKKYFTEEEIENLRIKDNLLEKTLDFVLRLFSDKCDKAGIPYIVHLTKVYEGLNDYKEKITALLHDVLEDTDIEEDDLKYLGYDEEIIAWLGYLTKKKGEYYPDYIDRIISSKNIHIYNIKLSDLSHNMDSTRIKNPTVNDVERITKRYAPSRIKLEDALEKLKGEK